MVLEAKTSKLHHPRATRPIRIAAHRFYPSVGMPSQVSVHFVATAAATAALAVVCLAVQGVLSQPRPLFYPSPSSHTWASLRILDLLCSTRSVLRDCIVFDVRAVAGLEVEAELMT